MKQRLLGICLIALGALGGCSTPELRADPAAPPPSAAAIAVQVAPPVAVTIPAIRAASTLIETGLAPDGSPAVPDLSAPQQASWFGETPRPGEIGPATLLGHVDGGGRAGVFNRLDQLQPGDVIVVDRADDTSVTFAVTRVETRPKADFRPLKDGSPSPAMRAVYRDTTGPELRLLTCGGDFDRAVGSYRDQVVVYAVLTTAGQP